MSMRSLEERPLLRNSFGDCRCDGNVHQLWLVPGLLSKHAMRDIILPDDLLRLDSHRVRNKSAKGRPLLVRNACEDEN